MPDFSRLVRHIQKLPGIAGESFSSPLISAGKSYWSAFFSHSTLVPYIYSFWTSSMKTSVPTIRRQAELKDAIVRQLGIYIKQAKNSHFYGDAPSSGEYLAQDSSNGVLNSERCWLTAASRNDGWRIEHLCHFNGIIDNSIIDHLWKCDVLYKQNC